MAEHVAVEAEQVCEEERHRCMEMQAKKVWPLALCLSFLAALPRKKVFTELFLLAGSVASTPQQETYVGVLEPSPLVFPQATAG